MPLTAADLTDLDSLLAAAQPGAPLVAQLRERFPGFAVTRCDAADVTEAPFRVYPGLDLHLLDTSDHCVRLTPDPAAATGLVLAQRRNPG